jgi:hypothetical protein
MPCPAQGIVDPDGVTLSPLALGPPDPLLWCLRRLPLAGHLVPPQAPRWGISATYRVRIRALPAALCRAVPCYKAVLLDAAP